MRLLKVTFGVILFMICALFSLRFYGLLQHDQAYDHPIMKYPLPWIIGWGGDQAKGPSHSLTAMRALRQVEGAFLGVNIQMNANKHFYALPPAFSVGSNRAQGKFIEFSDEDVGRIDLGNGESPARLEQLLSEFRDIPLFLWFGDNVENIDLRLEPILKKHADQQNILLHSEYDNVVKSLKKLLPQFLYGTGVGQRVRLLMLSSLWLEPVAAIDGDFLLSPMQQQGVSVLSAELKEELSRRQKVFILGPLGSANDNSMALPFGATGYLTAFPRDLLNKLANDGAGVDLSPSNR